MGTLIPRLRVSSPLESPRTKQLWYGVSDVISVDGMMISIIIVIVMSLCSTRLGVFITIHQLGEQVLLLYRV